jgi:Putative Flp pilus-assembly TadE/G-like
MTIRAALRRLIRNSRGAALPLVALSVSALIGFTGLGVETGLWYAMKRQNQSAADVAALSGAFELLAGKAYSDICGFAERDATRNGFTFQSFTCPTSNPACTSPSSGQMCANNPPVLGGPGVLGNNNAVEVILAQQQNALFASLYLSSVTIDTRAVAVVSVLDQACMLALDPSASNAIFIKGNPTLNMPNCSVVADSTSPSAIHLQGSASIIADTLVTAGGVDTTGNPSFTLNKPAHTSAPTVADPYAPGNCTTLCLSHSFLTTGMPTAPACVLTGATFNGNCVVSGSTVTAAGNVTLSANTQITGPWNIKNEIVNLSPGTYWVTDGDLNLQSNGILECTGCNPATGAGITIIFTIVTGTTVGTITGNSNANIGNPPTSPNFNAPNSGTFKGLLFVQDSNGLPAGATWDSGTLQGGPNATLNGLVYAPKAGLTFNGNPAAGGAGCLILVVNTLQLSGDSQLNSTGCSAAGVSPPTVKTVALAE